MREGKSPEGHSRGRRYFAVGLALGLAVPSLGGVDLPSASEVRSALDDVLSGDDMVAGPSGSQDTLTESAAPMAGCVSGKEAEIYRPGQPLPENTPHPVQADSLVESIGVNVHMHYGDTPYKDTDKVLAALQEIGVRHVRDYPMNLEALTALGEAGIQLSAVVGHPDQGGWAQEFDTYWANIKKLSPYIGSIEGTNEPDITFPDGKDDASWPVEMRTLQQRIWESAKSDPALRHIPIAGPSLTWPAADSRISSGTVAGDLGDISDSADWGNVHPYPGGVQPEDARVVDEMAATRQFSTGNKPVIATETGYHNQVPTDTGHKGASELADAIYVPRLFAHYYSMGIPRTFDYELVDQGMQGAEKRFGWVKSDFEPKPVYHAVKNMIELLDDPGAEFRPCQLGYGLRGGDAQTRTLLMQKRDGSYWLAIWQTAEISGIDDEKEIPSIPIELVLPAPAATIETFVPRQSVEPVARAQGTATFDFDASADMTLVKVRY